MRHALRAQAQVSRQTTTRPSKDIQQMPTLSLSQIEDLAYRALCACGASDLQARPLAIATAATEAVGVASHGLAYIPIYGEHLRCGKVIGDAKPTVSQAGPALLRIDAAHGFAHAAIEAGFDALVAMARSQGIAGMVLHRSYNCGVLGYHTTRLAEAGLLAIGATNAPASIAPSGGTRPIVGTNPISMAVPGPDGLAFMIDQSASTIAKSEVMKHAREGKPIPLGWALDADGHPTEDPNAALKGGTMAPAGDYKGVGLALIVEVLAAALSGATLGKDASPFSGPVGGPPATGQFFMAIDTATASVGAFDTRIADLMASVAEQDGARLPGQNRTAKARSAAVSGVDVAEATLSRIEGLMA
jgi:(2R)-3-sulfolactate dehydrogenase (NADP+)